MNPIDEFAHTLLEESKRFLEKATETDDQSATKAFLHAALSLSFCALEAHINAVCDEVAMRPDLTIHQRALLLEQDVRLENGEFALSGLKMVRTEDRVLFLFATVANVPWDKSTGWWPSLSEAISIRNKLTHPKEPPIVTEEKVGRAIQSIIDCIDAIYLAIYGTHFPYVNMGLHSTVSF